MLLAVVFSPDPQPPPFWVLYLMGVLVIISIRLGYLPGSRARPKLSELRIGDRVSTSLIVSGVVIAISGECVTIRLIGHPNGRNTMVVHRSTITAVLTPR